MSTDKSMQAVEDAIKSKLSDDVSLLLGGPRP